MVADKIFNLQTSSQLVYQSDIPIKGKTFIKVFIDKVGEGTWETIDGSDYQLINDSIVFSTAPTGFLLIMQVATTPTELQQTPTDISMLLTVREEIKELALHVGEIVVISENISSVVTVATNISDVVSVSAKLLELQELVDKLNELLVVSGEIDKVVVVADNIADINSVVTQIIPNLPEILQADTNAQTATTKALEASTSASNALASENKAEKWAEEDEDVPVETGKFSAKHWAIKAEESVTSSLIDDTTTHLNKTYSSSKIQDMHNIQAQSIANLATAQGEFMGTGSPSILVLSTSEQNLPFNVTVPSTNTDIIEFDDANNRVTFKTDASYNFRTVLALTMGVSTTRTVTVTGRNVADNSIVYQRTVTVNGSTDDIIPVNSNQLVTVGKNGIPSAPLSLYFTFKVDATGVTLRDLSSQVTSSGAYELGTITADVVVVSPTGTVSSTNVQDAIEELDTEKATKTLASANSILANTSGSPAEPTTSISLSQASSADSVARRTIGGRLKVGTATESDDATTKAQLDTVNTFVANDSRVKTALNAGGSAPIFACRAWANFNAVGTVTTRASGNVSTVGDGGIGDFTVSLISGMVDANYEISGIAGSATDPNNGNVIPAGLAVSNFRIFTGSPSDATKRDYTYNLVSIRR